VSIKITATNLDKFSKIEEIINKIDENFIKNFEQAEYLLEGYGDNIKLTSLRYYNEEIKLPKGFIIETINNEEYSEYEKDSNGEIKEWYKRRLDVVSYWDG
jgi:hypothetical protein